MRAAAHLLRRSLLLSVFLAGNGCSGKPTERQPLRLELSILTEKPEYRMGDGLRLETRFTNDGTAPFYLFDDLCWNPGNLLNIHAFNHLGKEVFGHSDFLRDCVPPPPSRNDTSRFIQLEPGAFEASAEEFDLGELVPAPGEYDLVVYYHSGISKEWISRYGGSKLAALSVWTSEYPQLSSNRLHITVRP